MSFFSKLFGNDKAQDDTINENVSRSESAASLQEKQDIKDDGELVAVIMAAIINMLSADAVSDLRIRSIRRIGRISPVWNTAGRDEYIASKL
jgi:hypothetical protein